MRVLITGGTGLIGRALAADLTAEGQEVVVLSRSPERATDLPAGVRVERWDARTADGWAHLADGAAAIVNLAGENIGAGRWTDERKRRIVESRLNAGQAVVQAVMLARHKPDVVIQASGVGYYGPCDDREIFEGQEPGSDWMAQVAVRWEASTAAVEEMGVRRAVIRSGVVLNKEEGAFPRLLLPFHFFAGGPLGSGKQWFSWIHLQDEVAAIRLLLQVGEASGPFNLVAPESMTNAAFARMLGRVINRPAFVPAPAFALRLLLGEMATIVLDGQRVIPRRLLDLGFQFSFPQAEAAVRDVLEGRAA